jgi:hypothetical protein
MKFVLSKHSDLSLRDRFLEARSPCFSGNLFNTSVFPEHKSLGVAAGLQAEHSSISKQIFLWRSNIRKFHFMISCMPLRGQHWLADYQLSVPTVILETQ